MVGHYEFVPQEQHIPMLSLNKVLERANIVSLHVPLIPATRHLIDAQHLERMHPQAVLIICRCSLFISF